MKAAEPISPLPPGSHIWPLTVAAYRVLGEAGQISNRTELINGVVYQKMSKSPLHSFLVMRLLRLMQSALPAGCVLRSKQPITCDDLSEPEPDVAIVRGDDNDFFHAHPTSAELVIEVCVTSHDYDRSKLAAYAAAGVKEVWLVLGPERQIEVYGAPERGKYGQHSLQGPGGKMSSTVLPGFSVDLSALFDH